MSQWVNPGEKIEHIHGFRAKIGHFSPKFDHFSPIKAPKIVKIKMFRAYHDRNKLA